MIAEVVSVGTELLLGQTIDTNAAFLAQALSKSGVDVYFRTTVGDNYERMLQTVRQALQRSDLVVTIGGLGPTADDITKEAVAECMGVTLKIDPEIERRLFKSARSRGYSPPPAYSKQALVPSEHGGPLPNTTGTAPGIVIENRGKIAICLPGPPNEFRPMVELSVIPYLAQHTSGAPAVIRSRTLRVIGVGESIMEDKVRDLLGSANPTIAPYAKLGECQLRITARASTEQEADQLIAPIEAEVRTRLGSSIYGVDNHTLEEVVVGLLRAANKTVATAKSCTGGLIAQRITSVPGASDIFGTGIVAYSNESKIKLLGVDDALLEQFGAVSEQVAVQMALGVKQQSGGHFGISTTGIAGPTGGTDQKPVGLVYVAIATPSGVHFDRSIYMGSRADIAYKASQTALALLRTALLA